MGCRRFIASVAMVLPGLGCAASEPPDAPRQVREVERVVYVYPAWGYHSLPVFYVPRTIIYDTGLHPTYRFSPSYRGTDYRYTGRYYPQGINLPSRVDSPDRPLRRLDTSRGPGDRGDRYARPSGFGDRAPDRGSRYGESRNSDPAVRQRTRD